MNRWRLLSSGHDRAWACILYMASRSGFSRETKEIFLGLGSLVSCKSGEEFLPLASEPKLRQEGGAERVQLLRRWLVSLKEVERLQEAANTEHLDISIESNESPSKPTMLTAKHWGGNMRPLPQKQLSICSSVAVNENDVVLKVLGERRGHRRAVGRVLRGTSHSHSSTTRLRDQQSTSESIQATNALKSKMETYMQQMNEFITLLTSNLQSVMPGIQLSTPPPPPPLSPTHEEELDSSRDEDYLSDL
ncbi:Uncharacterized protein Adt_22238 [Abeliophyllum distichum]|uniref:Uncharacterized protein n=1 Tax=Abeliophyllum distichum TaxID=126358 RepID=A0ABD1T1P0_9LAMI